MTEHNNKRKNIVTNASRPHMFIAELHLYIDYLKEQLEEEISAEQFSKKKKYFTSFYQNLRNGINYYRLLPSIADTDRARFVKALDKAGIELDYLNYQYSIYK